MRARNRTAVRLLVSLPLSWLTGLADGLALKDRATRHDGRDSPQQWVPRSPPFSVWMETQRKCARHISKGSCLRSIRIRFGRSAPNLCLTGIAHRPRLGRAGSSICSAPHAIRSRHRRRTRSRPRDRSPPDRPRLRRRADRRRRAASPPRRSSRSAPGGSLDVADAEACRVAADRVVERSGSLDVWVGTMRGS